MDASNAKGRLLETGVKMIEQTILRGEAKVTDSELVITPRMIIEVAGVHHEADLHIQLLRPRGYDATYIFECKNWKEKVDKNVVIVFSEKIKAFGAQRGFIAAPNFTADAEAQADLDPRIELLRANAEELAEVTKVANFEYLEVRWDTTDVCFGERGLAGGAEQRPIDLRTSKFVPDSKEIVGEDFLREWAGEVQSRRTAGWSSDVEGEHEFVENDERRFAPNQLLIDGVEYNEARLTTKFLARLTLGRIRARIDVDSRGSALQLEPVAIGGARVETWLVSTPKKS